MCSFLKEMKTDEKEKNQVENKWKIQNTWYLKLHFCPFSVSFSIFIIDIHWNNTRSTKHFLQDAHTHTGRADSRVEQLLLYILSYFIHIIVCTTTTSILAFTTIIMVSVIVIAAGAQSAKHIFDFHTKWQG